MIQVLAKVSRIQRISAAALEWPFTIAVLHYDDGRRRRSPTSAALTATTKRNTLRCRPILFPPPRFYLAGEDDAMKWHEKARYPFQLPPQILFEGTTYSDIKRCPVYEIMRAQKKLIRDGAHYRFFFPLMILVGINLFWGSSSNSLFVIGTDSQASDFVNPLLLCCSPRNEIHFYGIKRVGGGSSRPFCVHVGCPFQLQHRRWLRTARLYYLTCIIENSLYTVLLFLHRSRGTQ